MTNSIQCENIIIEATNLCNAKCIFCPREQYIHKLQHMPQDLFEKIVNESYDLGLKSITFGGFGEPLMDPGLIKKFEFIRKKSKEAKIHLTSTLFLLNENLLNEFMKYVDTVNVSFYGMTFETYGQIHGGSLNVNKSKENILSIIERKKTFNKKKPSIIMRFLLNDLNEHEMNLFISFWEPLVDEVMVWKPHNYLSGREYREVDSHVQGSCGRPFANALNFDVEGRVTVCCFDFNKELAIGNVKDTTVGEILLGDQLNELKNRHEGHDYTAIPCEMCDQRIKDHSVLVYSTDKTRGIGTLNLSRQKY